MMYMMWPVPAGLRLMAVPIIALALVVLLVVWLIRWLIRR